MTRRSRLFAGAALRALHAGLPQLGLIPLRLVNDESAASDVLCLIQCVFVYHRNLYSRTKRKGRDAGRGDSSPENAPLRYN